MEKDPRDKAGPFGQLFQEIRRCKEVPTCPALPIRPYYFEPNPETATEWTSHRRYEGQIDRRVVFVCESPGPSGEEMGPTPAKRCWSESPRDKRFQAVLENYGLHACYITNTVKCGPRQGPRHTDAEIDACIGFLVREIELLEPMVVVGVGGNAMETIRRRVAPRLADPLVLFQVSHYSMRRNPREVWDREFTELRRLLSRLRRRSEWEA